MMMAISELMQHLSVLYFLRKIQMSIWTHTHSSVLSSMKFIFLHLFHKNCSPFFKMDVGFFNFILLSAMALCVALQAPICSNAYGGWFSPCPCHSMRLTYRPSAAQES